MRLKVEINDLTPGQWEHAQRILQASYEIPEGVGRACLTVIHGQEERHVEMPASKVSGVLMGLSVFPAFQELSRQIRTALAVLTPDDSQPPRERETHGSSDHAPDEGVTAQDRDA